MVWVGRAASSIWVYADHSTFAVWVAWVYLKVESCAANVLLIRKLAYDQFDVADIRTSIVYPDLQGQLYLEMKPSSEGSLGGTDASAW